MHATWQVSLKDVSEFRFLGKGLQNWNPKHRGARRVFGSGALSRALQHVVNKGHDKLYGVGTADVHGTLSRADDLLDIFKDMAKDHRLKPVLYTYVIDEHDTWKFSETGAVSTLNQRSVTE